MPTHIDSGQDSSHRQGTESLNRVEPSGVATLWLVFYMLALGVVISSPLISRAIEFAALTSE
jgi:hypothetical protein